jgi:hypothetical protein
MAGPIALCDAIFLTILYNEELVDEQVNVEMKQYIV